MFENKIGEALGIVASEDDDYSLTYDENPRTGEISFFTTTPMKLSSINKLGEMFKFVEVDFSPVIGPSTKVIISGVKFPPITQS